MKLLHTVFFWPEIRPSCTPLSECNQFLLCAPYLHRMPDVLLVLTDDDEGDETLGTEDDEK